MKTILLTLLFAPFVCFGQADIWWSAAASVPKAAGGGGTCIPAVLYDETVPTATLTAIGNSTTRYYVGNTNITVSSDVVISSVSFALTNITTAGDISGKQFQVNIFTMNHPSLGDLVGSSDLVYGTNAWAFEMVSFPFTTKPTLTNGAGGGNGYAVMVTMNAVDAANYAGSGSGTPTANPGRFARFNSAGTVQSGNAAVQTSMILYKCQ